MFKGKPDTPPETLALLHNILVALAKQKVAGEYNEERCFQLWNAAIDQYLDPRDKEDIVALQTISDTRGLTFDERGVFLLMDAKNLAKKLGG